jgi:diguanylate cyclase (GGDEF)-like protein
MAFPRLDMMTMSIADTAVTAILGGLLMFAWLQNRSTQSLGWWGAANLVLSVAIVMLGAGGVTGNALLMDIGLCAMVFAYALMWNAARLFELRDTRPVLIFAGPCGWLVISFSLNARTADVELIVSACLLAAYTFAAAIEYWRGRAETLISRWPAILLLAITGAGFLAWVPLTIWMPISASTSGSVFTSAWFPAAVLASILGRVGLAFVVLAMAKERLELQQRTEALIDQLTGLPNRRAFFRQALQRMRPVSGNSPPTSLLLFDIDRFKGVNHRYGPAVGDRVLRTFADTLSDNRRPTDVIGRVSSAKFAMLMPEADLQSALQTAARVRRAFANAASKLDGISIGATVSVGVTSASWSDCSLHTLLGRADVALFRAKECGRDQVQILDPERCLASHAIGNSRYFEAEANAGRRDVASAIRNVARDEPAFTHFRASSSRGAAH